MTLRAGRKVGRTLYRINPDGSESLIGMVDTPDLAHAIVQAVNASPEALSIIRETTKGEEGLA